MWVKSRGKAGVVIADEVWSDCTTAIRTRLEPWTCSIL